MVRVLELQRLAGFERLCSNSTRMREPPGPISELAATRRRPGLHMKKLVATALILIVAGFGFRLFLALRLPNDEPDDGRLYAQIAVNVVEHRSYSIESEEPYPPTYIRVPGYPLFLAGVYSLFGANNNRAVRVVQAVLDTITCLLVSFLAMAWCPATWRRDKRRRAGLFALALAVLCPFPAIYVATILTETNASLLVTACVLAATLGMKSTSAKKSAEWWILAGLAGGAVTLFRPDGGMFVAAVGATLVLVVLRRDPATWRRTLLGGAALSLGFAIALGPWAIRNARVFGVFQPIAPAQANMPGEFVPQGYIRWLRTWVDDVRYTETLEWGLDTEPIRIENVPDYAFDSPDERERVAALLERYNHADSEQAPEPPAPAPAPEPESAEQASSDDAGSSDEEGSDESESPDDQDSTEETAGVHPPVAMTPDIDAGFAELASERIARHPIRYYLLVPLKRASSLWFDTHSQYYPFEGELLPLSALDYDNHQHYWLPLFMFLTLAYTGLGVGGVVVMWKHSSSRPWVLMIVLLTLPRIAFLSSMENPEPRYVVELFTFVSAAGGLVLSAGWEWLANLMRGRQSM